MSTIGPPRQYDRRRHGLHNLNRQEVITNPHGFFESIAELGPIYFDEVGGAWVCLGYKESCEVLSDHRRFSSARSHDVAGLSRRGLGEFSGVVETLFKQMLFSDPPEHTAVRQALSREFTPARVAQRDDMLRAIVEEVLDGLPQTGSLDLVGDFGGQMPRRLVSKLLDMEGDEDLITTWADAYERTIGSLSTLPNIADRDVISTLGQALNVFRELAAQRWQRPKGDDLISGMIAAMKDTNAALKKDALLDVIAANCLVLVAGGYQTLTHLVCAGLLLLEKHADQQLRLRSNPELIGTAINEILRIDGSSQYVARRVLTDTKIGGVALPAGGTVIVLLAAANLDDRQFNDPMSFDITRNEGRHLGFGLGRHHCIGAPYAERLAGIAITGFLDRYPNFHLEDAHDALVWGPHANTRCASRARVVVDDGPSVSESDAPPISAARGIHPAMTASERHLLTSVWNRLPTVPRTATCWHHVFERAAEIGPSAIAVDDGRAAVTYSEIDRRANALAFDLQARGVGPERTVAIAMERSIQLIIAILAVAKAGGAFLLADSNFPSERFAAMVEGAGACLVLTDDVTFPRVSTLPTSVVAVDTRAQRHSGPITGVTAGNTAYVVFTSGTTGRPKGIAISHESLVNVHEAQREVFRVTPSDRILQFLSLNFDGAVFEIGMALLNGATLVTAPAPRLVVGPPLMRLLRDMRVTVATMTPSVWAALPQEPLPDLRIAAAAGESLPGSVVNRWLEPGRRFLNLYGPAETAIWATWHECDGRDAYPPLGRPICNKQLYVTDDDLNLVPIGQDGELCIAGVGIGRYLDRPDLMSAAFCRNPFSAEPSQLLYRTGDICRWRHDGVLEFRGRRDRQVKIRGQRVELDEVERVLGCAPGVRTSVVAARNGQLTALIVPNGEWSEEKVRLHLRNHLHMAMIPTQLTAVNELPRTLNDKATALPCPIAETPTSAPQTTTNPPLRVADSPAEWTWRVAKLFASCLNIPQHQVKADSDFFDVGGDSLTVAALLAGLEREVGMALDVETLIEAPTPAAIAGLLHRGTGPA